MNRSVRAFGVGLGLMAMLALPSALQGFWFCEVDHPCVECRCTPGGGYTFEECIGSTCNYNGPPCSPCE